MTIRELAAGNPMIMDINIDIRENGKLKHIYRFGCGAEYYNSDPDLFKCKQIDDDPEDVKKYVTVDNTEINTHDIDFLTGLGYVSYWQDLNAKNYGVAQNRNRCFMFSFLGEFNYKFPKPIPLEKRLKDYLEDSVDEKYYIDNEKTQKLIRTLIDNGTLQNTMLRTEQNRPALTERLKNRKNEKLQTVSRQDMTAEYQACGQTETLLLINQATQIKKQIDIATTLMARDYKGFGNQSMNGVIEWK